MHGNLGVSQTSLLSASTGKIGDFPWFVSETLNQSNATTSYQGIKRTLKKIKFLICIISGGVES